MQYRRLGSSGLKLSVLSYGSWVTFKNQVDLDAACQSLAAAYERGVNFFDNAEAYAHGESERIMGQAIQRLGWPRDSFCVSSKVYFGARRRPLPTQRGLSRKHVVEACHQALERFGLDHLDLFFCHRPDPETPIEETVRAMHDLVTQGKVLYWGTSEWPAELIARAHEVAQASHLIGPSVEQPEYNLFARSRVEEEYAPLCARHGMGLTTWSPLASGLLTGKYAAGIPDGSRLALPGYEWMRERLGGERGKRLLAGAQAVVACADEMGVTPAQLAIAWCLNHPQVSSVILGASQPAQLIENLDALAVYEQLTPDWVRRIEQATTL